MERSDTTAREAEPTELVVNIVDGVVVIDDIATKPKAKEQLMLMMMVLLILTVVEFILFDLVKICKILG